MKQRTTEPGLNDTLDNFKVEVFRDFHVMKIGEIQSYDKTTASATVKIKIKEWTDFDTNQSASYPILADVPVFVLQGGGAWLEFPIAKGDPCLVFFSDRDIDTWWTSGNETTPNSLRKHDLSDCIAVVGVNPRVNPLALSGGLQVYGGPNKMDFANDARRFSVWIASFIDALIGLVTVGTSSTQALDSATQAALTNLKTQALELFGGSS